MTNKMLVLNVQLRCGSISITTPVSLLANEFHVRRVLHRQVRLAAVNQIYVIHEAMNGGKNLVSLEACFEIVSIVYSEKQLKDIYILFILLHLRNQFLTKVCL